MEETVAYSREYLFVKELYERAGGVIQRLPDVTLSATSIKNYLLFKYRQNEATTDEKTTLFILSLDLPFCPDGIRLRK